MRRRDFLKTLAVLPLPAAAAKVDLNSTTGSLASTDKMPALFIGHGSPLNAIEDNLFSRRWKKLAQELPAPRLILCVSAHWLTRGTAVTAMEKPRTIHDFGGFPQALFDVQYPAPGSKALAGAVQREAREAKVGLDSEWGLDHGTWSVLKQMYPEARIPVVQLSIDYARPAQFHYDLGRQLAGLRRKGVLIVGSGNILHNLRLAAFDRINEVDFGFDWALEMREKVNRAILEGDHAALIQYEKFGAPAKLAVPTPDHYYPLLYVLGLQEKGETPVLFNDHAVAGSLSMTSVRFG
jgi:4,5-DOPA dioxygenase extradiol